MTLINQLKFNFIAITGLMIMFLAMVISSGEINIARLVPIIVTGWIVLNLSLGLFYYQLQRDRILDFVALVTNNADDDLLIAYHIKNGGISYTNETSKIWTWTVDSRRMIK